MDAPISGPCDSRFDRRAGSSSRRNFSERGEVGAGVCVFVDGSVVVDLVGGWADGARRRPWRHDTLVDMYSAGKPFVALLALRQVDAGRLELDAPVASVWPEFAQAGKGAATVRQALCHRAGVPAIRRPLTNDDLWDWDTMVDALAATEPWWAPGTRHAYHTNTYGHLVGELVRRTGHGSCGRQLAALAATAGADVHFGVPSAELHRCAEVLFASPGGRMELDLSTLEGDLLMEMTSYVNPPGYSSLGVVNTEPLATGRGAFDERARHGGRGSRASMPPCWSRAAWCRQTCWSRRRRRSRRGTARSCTTRSPSASASRRPRPVAPSAPTPAASVTSGRAAPSASPTRWRASPSATS